MTANGNAWARLEETVFQVNDLVRRFWREGDCDLGREWGKRDGREIAFLVPAMFDKASRSFNWVLASPSILEAAASGYKKADQTKYAKAALPKVLKALADNLAKTAQPNSARSLDWQKFESRYSDEPEYEYIRSIHEEVKEYEKQNDSEVTSAYLPSTGKSVEDVWTAVLMAYACYPHPKDQNLEGIFFTILEDVGHSQPEIINDAVFGVAANGVLDLTAWKKARGSKYPESSLQDGDGRRRMAILDSHGQRYSDSRIAEAEILQDAFLSPLILDWDPALREAIRSHNSMLLAPVYDVWNGTQGWGGLKAVLLIFLKSLEADEDGKTRGGAEDSSIGNLVWERQYEKMRERCSLFAQEVSQTAMRRALARPIEPPYDLVRQFLRILIEVQDWEEAVVFYGEKPEYRFKREPIQPDPIYRHVREGWRESEPGKSEFDDDGSTLARGDERDSSPSRFERSNGVSQDGEALYMWWTSRDDQDRQDLWSKAILPGLSDDERAAVSGISIRFEFPKACRIPPDDIGRQVLVEAYRHQQLELMRRLIPKVRARRAALRNAVSAIMGRNMSHNIGSHVLARYAAVTGKTKTELSAVESEKIDPAADFLSYLQRRMDFLAEVGTSDKAFWAQPLHLGKQLDRLNLCHEQKRLRGGLAPLLTYITGKDKLPADVEFDESPRSTLFSCPGGEVGVHALYVILENVIRNSARHNPERRDKVLVKVCTESQKEFPNLIKLRITDIGSMIKEAGEGKKTLPQKINDIMAKEILNPDGRPYSEYWGIREMQICAQYLRQLQLSDLEDVPYAEEDMTAKAPLIQAEGKVGESLSYVVYLREAKLLATIARGEETKIGSMKHGVASVTLNTTLLASEEASRSKDELLEEQSILRDIRGYIFVAYNGEDTDLARWVKRHVGDLSPRCLRRIPPQINGQNDPKLLLEVLYEALASQIQKASDGNGVRDVALQQAELAGLVLAREAKLSAAAIKLDGATYKKPLTAKCVPNMLDVGAQFYSFVDKYRGDRDDPHHRLNACIWLDHPSQTDIQYFSSLQVPLVSISVESVFSHSPAADAICELEPGEGWELIAAALPRIVVLDERVQAAADGEIRKDLKARDCWSGMHVQVPTTEQMKLDEPTFEHCRNYLGGLQNSADYVILHLTVLEKLNDERQQGNADERHIETLSALLKGTPAEAATIMIATGRGVSTFARSGTDLALAKRVRFLPVSAFLEYLARRPSKLGLMRVLWSASSPRSESDGESNLDISRPEQIWNAGRLA